MVEAEPVPQIHTTEFGKEEGAGPQAPAVLDQTLDEAYLLDRIVYIIQEKTACDESLAKETAAALLSLRDGKKKLLWTRKELFELFQRQQVIEQGWKQGDPG